MKNYKNECFADDMNKCFEHDMNEWYNNEYYVLQWYDTSYAGCWRDKNRYQTLKEAQEYIKRWSSHSNYRIVKRTEEVIEYHKLNNKKENDDNMEKQQIVYLKERTEIKPCFYIDKNVKGVIKDVTAPDYYLVEFECYGAYWIDGKHLVKNN
jgi:NDP-sugar pyrophosphorylase family protein